MKVLVPDCTPSILCEPSIVMLCVAKIVAVVPMKETSITIKDNKIAENLFI